MQFPESVRHLSITYPETIQRVKWSKLTITSSIVLAANGAGSIAVVLADSGTALVIDGVPKSKSNNKSSDCGGGGGAVADFDGFFTSK
jgi:hypothetical protein